MNKIKGQISIDSTTIVCLLVIILVGLSSFGLGRLSVSKDDDLSSLKLENKNTSLVKEETGDTGQVKNDIVNNNFSKEKMYVASKNGKLYYPVSCGGANRISEKNKVWFATSSEAEKSGYELSSSCK